MFNLRAYVDPDQFDEVTRALHAHEGARHIVLSGTTMDTDVSLITAELDDEVADAVIEELTALGVRAGDLSIARVQVVRPMTEEGYSIELESQTDTLVWSEVTDEAVDNIGLRPSYLAYMAVAGVIAAFGVIDRSAVLIVGAMAVSPDLLPLTAASVGIVARRGWLFGRAVGTLLPGLATAVLAAWLVTLALRATGVVDVGADISSGVVSSLADVSVTTVCVAAAAGVAGMLSFETRASFAVGVAISVTTIPAAAYVGVAAGLGEWHGAAGALAVLGVNLAVLLAGGDGHAGDPGADLAPLTEAAAQSGWSPTATCGARGGTAPCASGIVESGPALSRRRGSRTTEGAHGQYRGDGESRRATREGQGDAVGQDHHLADDVLHDGLGGGEHPQHAEHGRLRPRLHLPLPAAGRRLPAAHVAGRRRAGLRLGRRRLQLGHARASARAPASSPSGPSSR